MNRKELAQNIREELANDEVEIYLDIEDYEMIADALEQEPRKGHWINKQRLFESCSAECSSCHKRSNGYLHDNGFSLESKYYDFCPKCGSDNREVEE